MMLAEALGLAVYHERLSVHAQAPRALLAWGFSQYKMIWRLKYLLVAIPGVLGTAAACLIRLRRAPTALFAAGGLLLTSSLCVSLSRMGTMAPLNQEQWREAAQRLRAELRPGDLMGYVKSINVFICPSNSYAWAKNYEGSEGDESDLYYGRSNWFPVSYAYNGSFFNKSVPLRSQ